MDTAMNACLFLFAFNVAEIQHVKIKKGLNCWSIPFQLQGVGKILCLMFAAVF